MKEFFYRIILVIALAFYLGFNVNAQTPNETEAYLRAVADKCLNSYFQIPGWQACLASESFVLDKNGDVSQIIILTHPKHFKTKKCTSAADRALLFAIKNAAPFTKPPASLHPPVKLKLTIDGTAIDKPLQARVNID